MKVGDRVKLSAVGRGEYENGPNNPHGMVGGIEWVYDYYKKYFSIGVMWDNGVCNQYRPDDLEPITTTRTLTVGETYTTKGGAKVVCIFILDDEAFVRFNYGNGVCGDAYRYNLDGKAISHSGFPDEYDIKFDPVVEWVDTKGSWAKKGEPHPNYYQYGLRFPLIDGKPDWSQAEVKAVE